MADGMKLPFPSSLFDLVVSKTVIEHMLNPSLLFKEAYRVLKPGGVFVWATSNLNSLPILVSRYTPLIVHKWVYRQIFKKSKKSIAFDQFPTYYRANTRKALDQELVQAGFSKVASYSASWPQYFAFNRPLFRLFLPIHCLSDWLGLELFQVHLIGVHRKEA
jgi:ubiquinone/menaquinone biosynthesis C-methylase UbiE